MLFKIITMAFLIILPQQRLADRVVAIVNDEPILLSELHQTVPARLAGSEQFPMLMRANLEALIDQTLILQEIKRLKVFNVEPGEVDRGIEQIIERYGSEQELLLDLRGIGMSMAELRASVQRKLLILKFIDYRFRQFINIDEEEIEAYYENEFLVTFRRENPGVEPPGLESQRQQIEIVLRERAINDSIDRWLNQARDSARIVIKY